MNLRQARYLTAIAEEGGITAAARKLYITQPSLSQMVHQIETELGIIIFDRSSQPLRPTYAGERVLHAARMILSANEILEQELIEIRQEDRGQLRLGISMQRSVHLLPRILPEFHRAYPKVILKLREAGSAALEQLALEGQVDLALASTESAVPGLVYQLLQSETVGILAGPDSPLAQRLPSGTPISLEQTLGTPLVALKQGHNVRVIQDRLFQELGQQPFLFLETDSMEAARQVTLSCGLYMLCVNSYPAASGAFYPLAGYQNHRHFYACYEKKRPLTRYMTYFLTLTRQVLSGPC